MIAAHPVAVPVVFIFFYIALNALYVAGAVFLSLLGGYLFPEPFQHDLCPFFGNLRGDVNFFGGAHGIREYFERKGWPFLKKNGKGLF